MSSIQLRVSLVDTKPPVWRRIIVPADATAYEFHHMLQLSMGWRNHHLFEYHYGFGRLGLVDDWGQVSEVGKGKTEMERITVGEMADQVKSSFTYLYDIGDEWLHRITVEEFHDKEIEHAICLEGQKACPPEDCGGVSGYYELLAILKNRFHKEHVTRGEWLKEYYPGWEKNSFDINKANEDLKNIRTSLKASRNKKRKAG